MRKNSRSSYTITVAPNSDSKNTYDVDLFSHIGNDFEDFCNDIIDEYADDTLTPDDFIVVDYDCPDFIEKNFQAMVNNTLVENEDDILDIIVMLEKANDYGSSDSFDDMVYLAFIDEDLDRIVVYGGDSEWSDYMDEWLETYHVKYTDIIYKVIDFDKLYEMLSSEYEEYDLPSGNKAWM